VLAGIRGMRPRQRGVPNMTCSYTNGWPGAARHPPLGGEGVILRRRPRHHPVSRKALRDAAREAARRGPCL